METKGYVVIEIQTMADGTLAILKDGFNDEGKAWQKYYTVLSFAAVSNLPCHAATIMDNKGFVMDNRYFEHGEEKTNGGE